MEITYRAAEHADLDEIFCLVGAAVEQMERNNIHPWDSIYPTRTDFENDIDKKELYVGTVKDKIAVVYALNRECDEQYRNGKWQYNGDNFIVIHRLCVSPAFQHKGVADTTIRHIESEAVRSGTEAVRLDVFRENPYALRLYCKNGYHKVGTADWRKGEFDLMEKLLAPCAQI